MDDRLQRHSLVSSALVPRSDASLAALLDGAEPHGSGIGGRTTTIGVGGVRVFVKEIPLTARELAAPFDTANLFGLPMFYQYGVGSAGFGAWRELAAHRITTGWVLTGQYHAFPLLHHWRILPSVRPEPDTDIEESVAYWGSSAAVRDRLRQLRSAPARLVLFLEHLPMTVHDWLRSSARFAAVESQLVAGLEFMNDAGLWHFDGHFNNLLSDGSSLYFADFGLALHASFDLTSAERSWLAAHADYDIRHSTGHLATWIASEFRGSRTREEILRSAVPFPGPPAAEAVMRRYADRALSMNAFFDALVTTSKETPYPNQ